MMTSLQRNRRLAVIQKNTHSVINLRHGATSSKLRLFPIYCTRVFGQSTKPLHLHFPGTHLVIHAIEKPRHHGKNRRPQGLHVIWEEPDVALIETYTSSMTVHHSLQRSTRTVLQPFTMGFLKFYWKHRI